MTIEETKIVSISIEETERKPEKDTDKLTLKLTLKDNLPKKL